MAALLTTPQNFSIVFLKSSGEGSNAFDMASYFESTAMYRSVHYDLERHHSCLDVTYLQEAFWKTSLHSLEEMMMLFNLENVTGMHLVSAHSKF